MFVCLFVCLFVFSGGKGRGATKCSSLATGRVMISINQNLFRHDSWRTTIKWLKTQKQFKFTKMGGGVGGWDLSRVYFVFTYNMYHWISSVKKFSKFLCFSFVWSGVVSCLFVCLFVCFFHLNFEKKYPNIILAHQLSNFMKHCLINYI